ncbi:MAG: hypothetical protein U0T74_04605 [Chitinophagales bacterium]
MKTKLIKTISTLLFVITTAVIYAQPGGTGGGQGQGGNPPGGGGGAVPIDGGAIGLVIGAAAYGYKRLKQQP